MKPILMAWLLLCISWNSTGQICSSTHFATASGFTTNTSLGSISWNNLSNAHANDGAYTDAGATLGILSSANTHYLVATGFGLSIPSGASICGIEVRVDKSTDGLIVLGGIRDHSVRIIKGGTITGSNLATSSEWTSTSTAYNYGGASESWGTSWTAADVNSAGFGVAFSARLFTGAASLFIGAEIDAIEIRVFYNLILPVAAEYFHASQQGNTIQLNWKANSTGILRFILQKEVSATSWTNVDSVYAVSALPVSSRLVIDHSVFPVNKYRLKMVRLNGSVAYSPELVLRSGQTTPLFINAQPSGIVHVTVNDIVRKLEVHDVSGRKWPVKAVVIQQGVVHFSSARMPRGVYVVSVNTPVAERIARFLVR